MSIGIKGWGLDSVERVRVFESPEDGQLEMFLSKRRKRDMEIIMRIASFVGDLSGHGETPHNPLDISPQIGRGR